MDATQEQWTLKLYNRHDKSMVLTASVVSSQDARIPRSLPQEMDAVASKQI